MKKRFLCTALFFEIAACFGAYLLQYFTARKLGMLRWVNHLCNKWARCMDLDRFHQILMILVSVLSLILLLYTIKKRKAGIAGLTGLITIALAAVGIYLIWILRYTRRLMAAYYLVSSILLLGAVIALICWTAAVLKRE